MYTPIMIYTIYIYKAGFVFKTFIYGFRFRSSMPEGNKKSRTFRRIKVRTPGARTRIIYKLRKPSKASCGMCGAILKGTTNARPTKISNMPKSSKKPSRAFSNLCSACSRRQIMARARL